jgi:integrase
LLDSARALDPEFGLLCAFLLYTGCRLSEALHLRTDDVNLTEGYAYVRTTKNGEPRIVHLPPILRAALANRNGVPNRPGKYFRLHKNSWLYGLLDASAERAAVALPDRVAFHAFRHTWGAWMRRYGGLDTTGLVATGAWRPRQAAAVYEHAVQSEEARRSDLLPDVWKGRGKLCK